MVHSVAFVGGIILTVLFSLLNFALNGFEMVALAYTQLPSVNSPWYQSFTALQSSTMSANCTPVEFPLASQFFTDQYGLTYTLPAIWTPDHDGNMTYLPALSYYNEPLENCSVFLVQVEIEELDRKTMQTIIAGWGAVARALVTCSVEDRCHVVTKTNLTTSYDAVPETWSHLIGLTQFVTTDRHQRASLWWGESLLSAWWHRLSETLLTTWPGGPNPPRKALVQWVRNDSVTSIMEPKFFSMTYHFLVDWGDSAYSETYLTNLTILTRHQMQSTMLMRPSPTEQTFFPVPTKWPDACILS